MRLRVSPVCFLLLWCWALSADAGEAVRPPNVLFIAVDDLRINLGCYGDPIAVTPNIDRLANSGLTFDRAYCQQAVCNPSRQSMMTGRRPDSIRVWNMKDHFRKTAPEVISLPEYFKKHGYFAQSFGKIYHGLRGMNDPQSWSVPEQFDHAAKIEDYGQVSDEGSPKKNRTKREAAVIADNTDNDYPDGKVASAAVQVMRVLAEREQPFFLAVGFRKPHLPFAAPKEYWDLYEREKIPRANSVAPPVGSPALASHDWDELRGYTDIPAHGPLSSATARFLRHGYYAATSFVDAQVGRVLRELKRLRLDRNTIVVLFSDHGFHLGEQGLWAKASNYELATRVPLIIRTPDQQTTGQRTRALVELIDIYPTLVELCGLPASDDLDGTNLEPLLIDPNASVKSFSLSQFPRPWEHAKPPQNMGYSLRSDDWRYVEWIDLKTRKIIARELYDMREHPIERVNLADDPKHSGRVENLSRKLAEIISPIP